MTFLMMTSALEHTRSSFLTGALVLLVCLLFACLLRAVKGPRVADRIVAVNMMGTMVMVIIGILALYLAEGYLVDICLIYAMVSFIAVIVLTKVYMGVYMQRRIAEEASAAGREAAGAGKAGTGREAAGPGIHTSGQKIKGAGSAAAGRGAQGTGKKAQGRRMPDAGTSGRENMEQGKGDMPYA